MTLKMCFQKDNILLRVANEKEQVRVFIILIAKTNLIDYQIW